MSTESDSMIQWLFARADEELAGEQFAAMVMDRIATRRRRALIGWTMLYAVVIACAALLAPALMSAAGAFGAILPQSLLDIEERWIADLLSPVNSVAALVALGGFVLFSLYRKIFR